VSKIALFQNDPECSVVCCNGMIKALGSKHTVDIFRKGDVRAGAFDSYDIIAFPGGIGDADSYDKFFRRKAGNAIADFVENGGHYLGICMGAYWAGSEYFDILDSVDAVQYIKRSTACIRRPYGTVAKVEWLGQEENMFFYDGCALIGDESKFTTVARYSNGDPMAIIQGRIGIIGCHPESEEDWYYEKFPYIRNHWHSGEHHVLLQEFVDKLLTK
jgi:Biotin-protein ligase, N terminal